MMTPDKHKEELPELLRNLRSGGDGFRQPEAGYFRQLGEQIIREEQSVRPLKARRNFRLPAFTSAAAAAVILLLAFWYNQPTSSPASVEQKLVAVPDWESEIDQIDEAEIRDYIEANIEDFDLELLAEDLPSNH